MGGYYADGFSLPNGKGTGFATYDDSSASMPLMTKTAGISVEVAMAEGVIGADLKVLVADDFASMRSIFKFILSKLGITNVDEAKDGLSALVKIMENDYDIIFLDWQMPKMTGLEVLKVVRENPALRDTPVIIVSVDAVPENILAAANMGKSDSVLKPFTTATLLRKIIRVTDDSEIDYSTMKKISHIPTSVTGHWGSAHLT